MAIDIVPLGAPDLGMTRAEMLEQANVGYELFSSASEMFFTLLFAYVVAMYLAGNQLTRWQYSVANAMHLLVMVNILYTSFIAVSLAHQWIEYAGLIPGNQWLAISMTMIHGILVLLSLWFGLRVRHPPQE